MKASRSAYREQGSGFAWPLDSEEPDEAHHIRAVGPLRVRAPAPGHPTFKNAGYGKIKLLDALLDGRVEITGQEEGSVFRDIAETGRIQVFKKHLFQIVPDGDLARLAALLIEWSIHCSPAFYRLPRRIPATAAARAAV